MNKKIASITGYFLSITAIWVMALVLFVLIQLEPSSSISLRYPENLKNTILSGIISGIIWGILFRFSFFLLNKINDFFISILLSIVVNIISAILLMYFIFNLPAFFSSWDKFPNTFSQLMMIYNSSLFYAIAIYFFSVGTLIQIFYDLNRKIGQGNFIRHLLGKYKKPEEEERIFLFMDLKSSTYYAEKLGHFKYSRLIQDCFNDISAAVKRNNVKIYQFVGDEVVLTWKINDGLKHHQCIKVFFDFINTINSRKEYYLDNYDLIPVFKAGAHLGKVMTAKVGNIRSEIAYHGDAINTASRIQSMCNEHNSRLLISGSLLDQLVNEKKLEYSYTYLGDFKLKGKNNSTKLYSFLFN
ncbi:MAG: adenylate/guanylate cyclase domain-containing protein [Labilibaculum sp.]|nr:adenylate/guanylate cyclase domain-containing protein [Labilibaculum sp.]